MSNLFAKLVIQNLPHIISVILYGSIAIVLGIIGYKIFSKIIPLNIGFESPATEILAAAILACGIMIGIGTVVAITAYVPPSYPSFPSSIVLKTQSGAAGLCGSCAAPHPLEPAEEKKSADTEQGLNKEQTKGKK